MALEEGDGILDYEDLANCLKKYEIDSKIFEKTMLLLNLYMNQPEWPHSFRIFSDESKDILGGDIYIIVRYGLQLIPCFDNKENRKIDNNFKRDLKFFVESIGNIIDKAYFQYPSNLELSSISFTKYEEVFIVKICRDDNQSLELSLSKRDIERFIESLESMYKEVD